MCTRSNLLFALFCFCLLLTFAMSDGYFCFSFVCILMCCFFGASQAVDLERIMDLGGTIRSFHLQEDDAL